MATLTKNAISVTVRDWAKRTKIWDHKGYKSSITNIFQNSKLKKNKMTPLTKNAISVTVRDRAKRKIWDHKGYKTLYHKYFKKFKILTKEFKMAALTKMQSRKRWEKRIRNFKFQNLSKFNIFANFNFFPEILNVFFLNFKISSNFNFFANLIFWGEI